MDAWNASIAGSGRSVDYGYEGMQPLEPMHTFVPQGISIDFLLGR